MDCQTVARGVIAFQCLLFRIVKPSSTTASTAELTPTQTHTTAPLSSDQVAVLRALYDLSWEPCVCFPFAPIVHETGLEVARVRAAARHLRALGLAEYHRGLFSEYGGTAGSGYCLSPAGRDLAWALEGEPS